MFSRASNPSPNVFLTVSIGPVRIFVACVLIDCNTFWSVASGSSTPPPFPKNEETAGPKTAAAKPVSYTHLTLPTKRIV